MIKNIVLFVLLLLPFSMSSQVEKVEINSKLDIGKFGSKEFFMNSFEGINKVDYTFTNVEKLKGRDFKIVIRKYKKGKLEFERIVADTKEDSSKINEEFTFSVISQQTVGQEKIMITFPTMSFYYKKAFEVDKKFEDGIFDYRQLADNLETGSKIFDYGKEIQIGLITPPNYDPSKGQMGYCEVTKSEIVIDQWYKQYQISEFFLIYLKIE